MQEQRAHLWHVLLHGLGIALRVQRMRRARVKATLGVRMLLDAKEPP